MSLTYTNTSSEDEVLVDYLSSSERDEEEQQEEEDVSTTEFDLMMNRGAYLRQLRMLALADEEERRRQATTSSSVSPQVSNVDCEEKKEVDSIIKEEVQEDEIQTLPNNKRLLNYNSYLSHQRYYDDLKHADIHYIDYGNIYNSQGENGGRLVVEQRKSLGKGGLCWDAAYCLAEFVIDREDEWSQTLQSNEPLEGEKERKPKIVDLGAGTGLCGLMLAKATNSHVEITEVPELEGLMADNVKRNFFGDDNKSSTDDEMITGHDGKAKGTISSRVLRWGVEEDYVGAPYDVIVGADIVTSLYDPVALAQTLHDLSHSNTRIYISGKSRLDKPHEIFNTEMNRLFEKVEKVTEVNSKLRSPGVFVICAEGKR